MKEMTSLERCLAVLNGEMPDYLPVIPQSFMFAVETAGMRIKDVSRNGRKMAEAHLVSREKYGYDGCIIDFDDATIAEALGAKVIFRDDAPAVVNEDEPVLKNLRDIYSLDLPDPNTSGRLGIWLETTSRLMDAIGDAVFVMGRADQGPFSIACLLRGTTQFMMDLCTEEEQVLHDVIEYCRKASLIFAKAQKDAGAHATSIGDALAGPNLISPEMYRQFAFEPEKKLITEVQEYGIPMALHICGNTNRIIEDMGQTEAKILEIDWQLNLANARKAIPESTILMGNVNPSEPLVFGTPEDVDQAVRYVVEATAGKGLFISSGCAMGSNTPPENMYAFIAAARKYGACEYVMNLNKPSAS
jgi:MtaA/CmuA family methyltransferase